MALSDEQNAMLRLLASGEQGYADIAALLGQSEDEVRAKVVGALAQLQAEGKPAPNVPPPIPGGAKPTTEVTPPEPEPFEEPPAPKPPKPAAAEPKPARPAAVPPASSPPAGGPASGGRTITLPTGRNAWLLGGGVVAAIVVIVVVILLASGGGGGSSSAPTTTGTNTTASDEGKAEEAATGSKEATQAELTAVDGSEAAGQATFGRVKKKLALAIEATGLEPTTEGTDSYTIWLSQSSKRMLPLASTAVKGSGKGANQIAAEFEIPVEILAYLAKGTFDQIAITRTQNTQLEAAIAKATKEKTTPAYHGEEVLRGTIEGPIVGLAVREEEAKKEEAGE